ncbi:hypothetical protein OO012_00355 [Rhodobacteraceae bacterium KMM 6894]|nr:hypothetical protein [Rhodobacteraceae bacterium KMM 6894]
MIAFRKQLLAACLSASLTVAPGFAQEAQGANVSIELNAVETLENGCRVSFLVQNGHVVDISKAVYEAVLFNTDGAVDRLTLFDFGALPATRPRVRQFVVPNLACSSFGRLLINGAETCTGANLPDNACTLNLDLRSRTDVEMLG